MHYKPGCRSNSKFGIIVSVTTTLFAALANRYHNKLFFCAEFPLFSKNTFNFWWSVLYSRLNSKKAHSDLVDMKK